MKRHTAKEWTVEEFDDWSAATDRHEAAAEAADEEGGPSLSLVPTTERNGAWPTDLLAPASESPAIVSTRIPQIRPVIALRAGVSRGACA